MAAVSSFAGWQLFQGIFIYAILFMESQTGVVNIDAAQQVFGCEVKDYMILFSFPPFLLCLRLLFASAAGMGFHLLKLYRNICISISDASC